MPKVKESEKIIPKLYRRSFADQSMFWWVIAQRNIIPAITIEKSLINYHRFMKHEDFNTECDLTTFERMQKELFEI